MRFGSASHSANSAIFPGRLGTAMGLFPWFWDLGKTAWERRIRPEVLVKRLACVLALCILPGSARGQNRPESLAALDNSGREQDCSAAATKAVKNIGQKDRLTWSAHYSARYKRCFLELTYHQTILSPDNQVLGRVWVQRLDDVYEHRVIAFSQTTDGSTYGIKPDGWIPSRHPVTPQEAKQFIDDMMGR